jgi:hypothetical protein
MIRDEFEARTGLKFAFETLASNDREICFALVDLGIDLYSAIAELRGNDVLV